MIRRYSCQFKLPDVVWPAAAERQPRARSARRGCCRPTGAAATTSGKIQILALLGAAPSTTTVLANCETLGENCQASNIIVKLVGFQPTVIASRAPHLLLEQSVMTKIQRIVDVRRPSIVKPARLHFARIVRALTSPNQVFTHAARAAAKQLNKPGMPFQAPLVAARGARVCSFATESRKFLSR